VRYYLSTIADVDYDWNPETETGKMIYIHKMGPLAKKYQLGLELAEFCISDNCQNPADVMPFFEENTRDYTSQLLLHAPFNELMPHTNEPLLIGVCDIRYGQSYALAERYGCEKMIVHANFVPSLYFESWFIEKQTDYWKRFMDEHPGNCILCVENVMEARPELITEIVARVNNPRFRMCLDIGHANLFPVTVEGWLEASAPYLSHLHIHNNNGPVLSGPPAAGDLHHGLGNGIIDYEAILKKADALVPEGLTATIESVEAESSCSWLKEKGFI